MTMMARSRDFRTKEKLIAGAIAVVALLAIFFAAYFLKPSIRALFANFSTPREENGEYALMTRDALIARLSQSEALLARIRYQALFSEILVRENAALRVAAHAVSVGGGITARVIARPPRTNYDTLLLDSGSAEGLHEDDLAVFEGIALGKVRGTGGRNATVELFSSPGVEHDVILGEPAALGIARGLGGGAFEVSVSQDVKVSKGDLVRIPHKESLILGVVLSVSADPRNVSETVRFATPVSFAELDFIRIVSP